MRTASPWWLSLVLLVGLAFTFLGERIFSHESGMRGMLTMIGLVLVLGVTLVRAWTMLGSSGSRRRVERILLLCHVGTCVALVLYALTTSWGLSKLSFAEAASAKFAGAMTVLFVVLLVSSLVPVLFIELSLGTALRETFDIQSASAEEAGVELYRVREMSWSGLSVALALGMLMVTCSVANQRNVQKDVSYFKTSAPGDSTKAIAASTTEPIRVLLFYPEVNEVKEQVTRYFEALASATGGKLSVEAHDRFLDAELAAKYKVTKDGTIVVVRGKDDKEKSQNLDIDPDIDKARKSTGKLRNLDREVNTLLLKLVRDKRKAYVMTGHGEMNDPDSVSPDKKGVVPDRRTTVFKKRLGELNYEVKDLGLIELASDVPTDATVVIMLAPTSELQPAEWDALDRYLARGGRLLVALDPKSAGSLGSLQGRLGLTFNPGDLTDDKAFLPQRGTAADRRFAITTQFSAHASTTALSRSVDKGLLLIDSGALEDAPFTTQPAPTKTITIRSMETSFLDLDNNFTFDAAAGEKRQRWNIGAAIEGPKGKDADGKDKDGFRALVFADADLFADVLVQNSMGRAAVMLVSGPLLEDSIKWLGGEELFAGDVVSEDDKPIKHTKDQDAKWFSLTIVAGPVIVLTLGLVGTWVRRRRTTAKKTTTKKSEETR